MNEVNHTIPTAEVVRCKDCAHAKLGHYQSARCENTKSPARGRYVWPQFYCQLGELLQQSHGNEPI